MTGSSYNTVTAGSDVLRPLCSYVVIGGLNPAAVLEEKSIRMESKALAGLVEYERLFHYREMERRIRSFY